MKIVKAILLEDYIEHELDKQDIKHDDLVFIHIEKIEGSPTEWLQERFLKDGE